MLCGGTVIELTVRAVCEPECGTGAWVVYTEPPDVVETWIDADTESVDCDGDLHSFLVRAKIRCDYRGLATFRVDFDAPGDQYCESDVIVEVVQCPDVDMDADRNGLISAGDDDEEGEDDWQYGPNAKGAIVLVNCDNDGGRTWTDPTDPDDDIRDLTDTIVNGPNDIADLSEMILRPVSPPYLAGWKRRLRVPTNASHPALRVFLQKPPGTWTQVLGPTQVSVVLEDFQINPPIALNEELHFGVESVLYPGDKGHASFDGLIVVEADLLDDQNTTICTDTLQLRVAPFIILPNTAPPHRALVSDYDATVSAFVQTQAGTGSTALIPYANCSDWWAQDAWEFGFSSRPGGSGSTWNLWSGFETLRAGATASTLGAHQSVGIGERSAGRSGRVSASPSGHQQRPRLWRQP
ncbi:MAG: hypothetical protein FLDDKLPJ_00189 [Phycisphaerae bacterium]|nr:hypothetical protein [Phycisphaerae bacterium]